MKYISTRGGQCVSAATAIMQGIASEGGLFIPQRIPLIQLSEVLDLPFYWDVAAHIMHLYLEEYDIDLLKNMAKDAYASFDTDLVVPLRRLCGNESVAELWHGPTMAFKDVALQMLPRLMRCSADREKNDKQICILVATSGDTGKAALEGFRDVEGTSIIVFYPNNGVSVAQRLQMVTQEGNNVHVCAIEGNFDDAQTALKKAFCNTKLNEEAARRGHILSSANSINFGRLLPQIVYYYTSYLQLCRQGVIKQGEEINFCVPTGNFGDILAGHYAKQMGLPVHKFICASNQNRVLTDFFESGRYCSRREFYKSMSCSIDILVSSNLERYLFELCDGDTNKVTQLTASLKDKGEYTLTGEQLIRAQEEFVGYCCSEEDTLNTIRAIYGQQHYLMDPHTAVAQYALDRYREDTSDNRETVLLSTASPYKFATAVLGAFKTVSKDDFENVEMLHQLTGTPIPAPMSELKGKKELYTEVIPLHELDKYILTNLK
ncbi:MAG: threonine synthase [Eubacteriales bacterium]|nr:threonine synthase [Eubacteriales bacterium]